MFRDDEINPEMRVVRSKSKDYDAQQLQWPFVSITEQKKMSRSYLVLSPADRKDVGAYEVRPSSSVEDSMKGVHSAVI